MPQVSCNHEFRREAPRSSAFSLPVGTSLVVVFVLSKDRDGNTIDQDKWVDQVLTTLGQAFRGGTAYPRGRGVWRDDERGGTLIREDPVVVFSYAADEEITTAALTALYQTLSRMGRETRQGEVGVVIDGKYYGITEYSPE
ncbi:MAG: hypothetical protein L0Y71_20885 [Gemmataceae bacterium]|nr:hypothetical protein [Gemmataceae bacterium]